MSTTLFRITGVGLFFLCIFLSGFWLSHSGKPYSSMILNIHKLIALAAVVFLVITVYRINQTAKLSPTEFIASVVTGLLFLVTIISGGLASLPRTMPTALLILHHLLPYFTVLSTAVTLYLLVSGK
ncbi:MAG: hypothetical protein ACETWG_13645 [Candidatus Neomarinimicrobiota bacterium]